MLQDLRYVLRLWARTPGFTTAALLSLAIGIGANTSIFSIVNALLLHQLPYRDADRLVILWNRSPGLNITQDWFSTAQYFDVKNGHQGFEDVAIAIGRTANVTGGVGEPERIGTILLSSNLLPMLGARPALGRLFLPEENSAVQTRTAILLHSTWERRFGSDPKVIGKPIALNGVSYTIAGVLGEDFTLPHENLPTLYGGEFGEILLPLPLPASAANVRTHEDYNIIAKLKRGVSIQQAQAEMDTITARLRRDYPEQYPPNGGLTFGIVPLLDQVVGGVRRTLAMLLAAVGLVLLIACANVANLLLARALGRRKEIALRAALGASGTRLLRQLLTESVFLALCGGTLGAGLSAWSLQWIRVLGSRDIPRLGEIAMDTRVLLFTACISMLSGIAFGLAPALRLSRLDLNAVIQDASRARSGVSALWRPGHRARTVLVTGELALSVILLIGAGLLIRSFVSLLRVDPGFSPRGVLTLNLTLSGPKYNDSRAALEAYRKLWDSLDRLPGAAAAGGVSVIPLGTVWAWGPITVEGRIPPPGENFINADQRIAAGRYFQAMEIPLLRGRLFDEHDTQDAPRVIVVDEYMAGQLWPGQDPIGKRIRSGGLNSTAPWLTVIGVVGRVKQYTLDMDSRIAFYYPQTQVTQRAMDVVVRSSGDPAALASAVKREIQALDPDLPVYNLQTMQQRVASSLAARRFSMTLLDLFAGIAVALAMIGVYGVMSLLVSQGTREIGIRLALGASPRGIVKLLLFRAMTLSVTGIAVGALGAAALGRLMNSFLFGVKNTDPVTSAIVAVLLISVVMMASIAPVRRASRIDPVESLRCE